jgi:hypothetical protein
MLNYEKARKLAQTWINLNLEIEAEIIEDETIIKPYGWVFFYQSKSYLETQNFSDLLLGNSPILIDKINGEIKVFGTARHIEEYLSEYEKTIPQVW